MKQIFLIFFVLMVIASCYHEVDYQKPLDDSLFKLEVAPPSIDADGYTTTKLTVTIPSGSDTNYSYVTLKTTSGTFVEGGSKTVILKAKKTLAGDLKIAETYLRSSLSVEKAIVSVEFFDYKKSTEINFTKASPENIDLTAAAFSIRPLNSADGEVSLEATVRRSQGIPSLNTIVDVVARDSNFTRSLGSFRTYNNRSNESGKTNFVFVLGDSVVNTSNYTGRLYLIAKTVNAQNIIIADTVQLISTK